MTLLKKPLGLHQASPAHWVGDGFPVRSLFSYRDLGRVLNPFILLDHAGPARFEPAPERTNAPRGVGAHPHRGFETVTIVTEGQVAHGDSAGNSGQIGPGDVQWMTAGKGVLHQEFHAPDFTRTGGAFEMAQLWINLPARDKMTAPAYQPITAAQIPALPLPDEAGTMRVIAGDYTAQDGQEVRGPARTFTPLSVWDLNLKAGKTVEFQRPEDWIVALAVFSGSLTANGAQAGADETLVLGREGTQLQLTAQADTTLLVLAAEPLEEPIVGQGPFVMNTQQEIIAAFEDLRHGQFGAL